MIVDTASYIISMLQVYGTAILLLFGLPLLMWKNYLKNKSMGECFLFCVITQTAFLVNLVLLLGFLDICTPLTVGLGIALEFLLIRWTYSDKQFFKRRKEDLRLIFRVIRRQETFIHAARTFSSQIGHSLRAPLKWRLWKLIRENWLDVMVVLAALIYNAIFLNHNVLIYHSYQFSDNPVHLSWVYELEHGTLFSAGIYPFAMHSMIYVIRALTGIQLREVVLYYGGFQTLLLIVSLFLLARRLFKWRYTPYLVLVLFSIMLNQGRYAASLPQECGMFASAGLAYYLTGYLNSRREKHIVPGDSKARRFFRINQYFSRPYFDYQFWMLALCVSLVIGYHFYTAIASILLALAIVGVHFFRFIKKQYLVPIVCSALIGVLIAVLPFAACFAKGIPFQESMNWAMSVIEGTEWQGTGSNYQALIESGGEGELGETAGKAVEKDDDDTVTSIFARGLSGKEIIKEYADTLLYYQEAYLFGSKTTPIMLVCAGIGLIAGLIFLFFKKLRIYGQNYLALLCYLLLIITFGCFQLLGLTVIFEANRASVFTEPYFFLMLAIPMDVLFCFLGAWKKKGYQFAMAAVSLSLCGFIGVSLVQNGFLHNYFDVNLSYYNEPDYLISKIRKDYPDFSYSIISPTDELYAMRDNGSHYELSEFVAMVEGKRPPVKFEDQYVFIFIEKKTLQDQQFGSDWVSEEYANMDFTYTGTTQDYYFQRNIVQSKAYYWAEAFAKLYPNQVSVYFEDDIYICYLIQQNRNSPLDMRIEFLTTQEAGT